jgi:alkylhydroperoxidase family enzyme
VSNATAPRLAPLPREQWDDGVVDALRAGFSDEVAQRFATTGKNEIPVPNVLGTLLHHPALAGPFLAYNQVLLSTPALEPRHRELMVLRVAWRARSRYEWVQHARIAQKLGVTGDEVAAIAGRAPVEWAPLERALLDATDQLVDGYRVDDGTWKRLADQLDERQLVELVFVVGTYVGLAMAFNSFGLQVDPDLRELDHTLPEFEE